MALFIDQFFGNAKLKKWIECFCTLLSLDYTHLVVEFEERQPIAKRIYDAGGVSVFQTWA